MKSKNKLITILNHIWASAALSALLLAVLLSVAFDSAQMNDYFTEYANGRAVGITEAEYAPLAHRIASFLRDGSTDINVEIPIGGTMQSPFTDTEMQHMSDVAHLF